MTIGAALIEVFNSLQKGSVYIIALDFREG